MNHHTGWLSPFVDGMRMRRVAKYVKPGDVVLDVGCGPGHLQKFLPKSCDYNGIEKDKSYIGPTGVAAILAKPIYYFDAAEKFPFDDKKFDVIIMASFLEHIDNPSAIFPELERVLAPNGIIVATTPTPLGGKVHAFMAKMGMLSEDAAHDHTHGFLTFSDFYGHMERSCLRLASYKQFQFGLNQIVVWKKV